MASILSQGASALGNRINNISSLSSDFHGSQKVYVGKKVAAPQRRKLLVHASFNDIPKQFQLDNLKEGLAQNYKNFPRSMYGLTPYQMDMLLTDDSPLMTENPEVNEETISAQYWYRKNTGMWSMHGLDPQAGGPSPITMSARNFRASNYTKRPRSSPPDLPTILLDNRVVYIGMPIVRAVSELICAELFFLNANDPNTPIYLYINSSGALNDQGENIAFESDTYAIADVLRYVKPKIYTVNVGRAFGQAAMLLAMGEKGYRGCLENSCAKIYAPKVGQSGGSSADMWIKSYELEKNAEIYCKFLAEGTGKSFEQIRKDVQRPRFFMAEDAIEYGLIDKVVYSPTLEKKNYDKIMLGSRAPPPRNSRRAPEASGAGAM